MQTNAHEHRHTAQSTTTSTTLRKGKANVILIALFDGSLKVCVPVCEWVQFFHKFYHIFQFFTVHILWDIIWEIIITSMVGVGMRTMHACVMPYFLYASSKVMHVCCFMIAVCAIILSSWPIDFQLHQILFKMNVPFAFDVSYTHFTHLLARSFSPL